MGSRLKNILMEAQRRRVFRTAGVYLVAVWGLSQGAVDLAPLFGAPVWLLRWVVVGAVALLPAVVVLAWMFDIGRRGIVRDARDLEAARRSEVDIADMPTMVGAGEEAGAMIVRWNVGEGEEAVVFLDEFFIGRGNDCRIRFYDPLVSRRHARVFREGDLWQIEDLGSRNGTLLDEKRIERAVLGEKNEVRVNEAGPVLHLDSVPAGVETRAALATMSPGRAVGHVRGGPDLRNS